MAIRSDHTTCRMIKRLSPLLSAVLLCAGLAQAQDLPAPADAQPATEANVPDTPPASQEESGASNRQKPAAESTPQEVTPKRILGIIPNFRTTPTLKDYAPITTRQKFKLATQDSFDRGTVILSALFAGMGQATDANHSFGQGAEGYGKYFGTSFADFVIGNYMTEGIYPTIFHQDPRYFRRGTGGTWARLGSAVGQIFWTRRDAGGRQFNFSEIAGNSTAVAISNAYYPDNRNASDAASRLVVQIGVDMASNILKEFSPEISHLFARKQKQPTK
jgi:hypothetical protein